MRLQVRHLKHAASDYQETLAAFNATRHSSHSEDAAARTELKLRFTLAKHSYAELAAAVSANDNSTATADADRLDGSDTLLGLAGKALRESAAYLQPGQTWGKLWLALSSARTKKLREKASARDEMVRTLV